VTIRSVMVYQARDTTASLDAPRRPADRSVFLDSATSVAKRLLGSLLIVSSGSSSCAGRIVEVEAYTQDDPASHSFRGVTPRNRSMFLVGGHLYVYRSYGVHWCLNVATGPDGVGEAVLIRALEPIAGIETMADRRGVANLRGVSTGPGRLTQALGIDGRDDGVDVLGLRFSLVFPIEPVDHIQTTRIGISRAEEWKRRFYVTDSSYVSPPRKKETKRSKSSAV
jgi:DNA-3-methyladenine glycosylase